MTEAKAAPRKTAQKEETLNIYQIISKISQEAGPLAPTQAGGVPFSFRGIDGTVAHLAPLLDKYGIVTVPEVLQETVSQAPSGNKVVTTTRIKANYHFYAPDGTSITATTAGLANDYADRSTAQAQSVAFRVALLQTFHLPTNSPEPEQTGVEPIAHSAPATQSAPSDPLAPHKTKIVSLLKARGDIADGDDIKAKVKELGYAYFNSRPGWDTTEAALKKWATSLENGEVK